MIGFPNDPAKKMVFLKEGSLGFNVYSSGNNFPRQ